MQVITRYYLTPYPDHDCMNHLYSFRAERKLKSREIICIDHDYYHMIMHDEDKNILKYNQDNKS